MKKIVYLLVFIFLSTNIFSQQFKINTNYKNQTGYKSIDKSTFDIQLSLGNIDLSTTVTDSGKFLTIENNYLIKTFSKGNPDLPVYSKLIEIPQDAIVVVKVVSYNANTYKLSDLGVNNKIIPGQLSIPKNQDPKTEKFYINDTVYKSNKFWKKGDIAYFEQIGQMRDSRLGRLEISPFEYNPVTNELKVYNNLIVEIKFKNADWTKTDLIKKKYASPFFADAKSFVLNNDFGSSVTKSLVQSVPVTYVIVSPREFEAALQPLVTWKKLKGFKVIEAYTDVIGTTTTTIKSYLQGLYNTPPAGQNPPSFILIVGDIDKIPAFQHTEVSSSPYSDLDYAEYTGDYLPEVNFGRISADNAQQVSDIVAKTIRYERYEMADPSYLHQTFLVAGDEEGYEDTYGGGAIWYADNYYLNSAHNIQDHLWLQSTIETWGGNTTGNSRAHDSIIANINNGVALANYTAHCSPDGWASPSFTQNDLNNYITNVDKFGLWIGNCCQSNKFDENEAFGEIAIRKPNAGVIGYIGGSQFTYWDEDYYWGVGVGSIVAQPSYANSTEGAYDGVFHDMTNEASNVSKWFTSNYQIILAGNLAVQASSSPRKPYYWVIYQLAGDPSVMSYIGVPTPLSVTLNPSVILIGATNTSVTTEPYAYICFTQNDQQIGIGQADASGNATINFSSAITSGDITLVVTAQFKQPNIQTITPNYPNTPYVVASAYTPNTANYAQTGNINASFTNFAHGNWNATNVVAILRTTDSHVKLLDTIENIGTLNFGTTTEITNAFNFSITDTISDQYKISFNIVITGTDSLTNTYTWVTPINVTVNAPKFEVDSFYITDNQNSNNNGVLEPGESGLLNIIIKNIGHADADSININITGSANSSPYLEILKKSDSTNIQFNNQAVVSFDVSVNTNAVPGDTANLAVNVNKLDFYKTTKQVSFLLGPFIKIGNGTSSSEYYPLYNYYENNKTQMLYLSKEINAGKINKIGFFITNASTTLNDFTNLTIKFKETSAANFNSAYTDFSNSTTVFGPLNVKLPTTSGLYVFDINDFDYSGNNNLAIELTWGDNQAWDGNYYTVSTTTTDFNSVAYGYDDNQTFPVYKGSSTSRPNLAIFYRLSNIYSAFINVVDTLNNPVTDAILTLGSSVRTVDDKARTTYELTEDTYKLFVYSPSLNCSDTVDFSLNKNITMFIMLGKNQVTITKNNEIKNKLFVFYPNPAKDLITVSTPDNQNGVIEIIDLNGKTLKHLIVNTQEVINVSDLQEGIYILKFTNNFNSFYNKLIIK